MEWIGSYKKALFIDNSIDIEVTIRTTGFPGSSVVKNQPVNAGDAGDTGLIPGSGRLPGVGNGNPLQYCLENSMDREAWWAAVHGAERVECDWACTRMNITTTLSFRAQDSKQNIYLPVYLSICLHNVLYIHMHILHIWKSQVIFCFSFFF